MAKQSIQQIKQRFGIIGSAPELDRAIDVALQVAPTDLSVLITGGERCREGELPPDYPSIQQEKTWALLRDQLWLHSRGDD